MIGKILLLVLEAGLLAAAMYLSYRSGKAEQRMKQSRAWVDALGLLERKIERLTQEAESAETVMSFIDGAEWMIRTLQECEEENDV